MAETEINDSIQEDAYVPEEPTSDVSNSLLDIQMPETPESTKGQASDGDSSRMESPKMLKPVLGKVQAKKRLMAFVNKLNVLPKLQNKTILSQTHSLGALKSKDKLSGAKQNESGSGKMKSETDLSHQSYNRSGKSKKKTEEKILAIEEIRREESKSKMLLAEAMAAASIEEENFGSRNSQNMLENIKSIKNKDRLDDSNISHRTIAKSTSERKYTERRWQHGRDERAESTNRESRDRNENKERGEHLYSQGRDIHRKDKERRVDKDKRDDNKVEGNRDKRDDGRDKRDSDRGKSVEIRERKEGIRDKRDTLTEKLSNSREEMIDVKEKKNKDKYKYKEKHREIIKYASWAELRKYNLSLDDIIHLRRRNNVDHPIKNRTVQDYGRYFEQMLMLDNHRLKRCALIAEGIDGPKAFHPESVRSTKRGKGSQVLYCENPRVSLLLNHHQILQAVTFDRREKMQGICEPSFIRDNVNEPEEIRDCRNWYNRIDMSKSSHDSKLQLPINIQFPKSKWDSEDEEMLPINDDKTQEKDKKKLNDLDTNLEQHQEEFTLSSSTIDGDNVDDVDDDNDGDDDDDDDDDDGDGDTTVSDSNKTKRTDNDNISFVSPSIQTTGNEKLASEYEQFMKMVCTDISLSTIPSVTTDHSPQKILKSTSPSSYHEFNLETNLPDSKSFTFLNLSNESEKPNKVKDEIKVDEKLNKKRKLEYRDSAHENTDIEDTTSNTDTHRAEQKSMTKCIRGKDESDESGSVPSDWEHVNIKVERLSDENSEVREISKKKAHISKEVTSSSESSSTTSSSYSEDEKSNKKRKRKLLNDSSSSDSDSSESSSSSSSESSSSDDKRRKRKRKKKIEKKKKKTKRTVRTKKKRRRTICSNSSSSDSDKERRRKRTTMKKKMKDRKIFHAKSVIDEDIIKVIQKSPVVSDDSKLTCSQGATKKIKEENVTNRKHPVEKRNLWDKEEARSLRKVIPGNNTCDNKGISQKAEAKTNETEERYLEVWEIESVIAPQQNEELKKVSKQAASVDKEQDRLVNKIDKIQKGKKEEKNKKDDQFRETRVTGAEATVIERKSKIPDDLEGTKKKKKDKEKRSSNEFIEEWERESERITRQIIQDEVKLSKKLDKYKKEKLGETEFDMLNVPSLTQLEREVSKRQLLADEWEVDSLEAVPDLTLSKKKAVRGGTKKVEREIKYDKKSDMYISVNKESTKSTKKKQDRLCAIRIWEEEQEEGEREQMMLMEEKNKRKKDDWDIEEESFLSHNKKTKENVNVCNITSIPDVVSISQIDPNVTVNERTTLRNDVIKKQSVDKLIQQDDQSIAKKIKKSRWDMGSHNDNKNAPKAPVMWEEECSGWSKTVKYEKHIDKSSVEIFEPITLKNKVQEIDTSSVVNQQVNIRTHTSKNVDNKDVIDLFYRQPQDVKLLETPWIDEEIRISKNLCPQRVENNLQKNVNLDQINEHSASMILIPKDHQTSRELKDVLNLDIKLREKDAELYSPSSPALSQKSEGVEMSSDTSSCTIHTKEDILQKNLKQDTLFKKVEETVSSCSIPLQLKKFHGNVQTPQVSATKGELENTLEYRSEERRKLIKFDIDSSDKTLKDVPLTNPYIDVHNRSPFKSSQMDIFAEYESDESPGKISSKSSDAVSVSETKDEDMNEGKSALKLIPKQLLIRRTSEQVKPKRITESVLQDPVQHSAALLTIQNKLLRMHALKNNGKEVPNESSEVLTSKSEELDHTEHILNIPRNLTAATASNSNDTLISTDNKVPYDKDVSVIYKSEASSLLAPHFKPGTLNKVDHIEVFKEHGKRMSEDEIKVSKLTSNRNINDEDVRQVTKSPFREQRHKSPMEKEIDKKYISERDRKRKDKKYDGKERCDKGDNSRLLKSEYNENRRKGSPSSNRAKRKKSGSPSTSWECERSGSGSCSRSWSRSASKSPKRKDDITSVTSLREREKRSYKIDEERSNKSRFLEERKERSVRSPTASNSAMYSKDNFKRHLSSKFDHDEWNKRKYSNLEKDREKEARTYDPMEILRERNVDTERLREDRSRSEKTSDSAFWQYEMDNPLRDGNESLDTYTNVQDLDLDYENRPHYRDGSLERETMGSPGRSSSRYRKNQKGNVPTKRDRHWEKDKNSSDLDRSCHVWKHEKLYLRNSRPPPRPRRSPIRSSDRFRRRSNSRSRSWSRSRSRTRSRSRSKSRSRSRSRSSSRLRSRSRSSSRSRSKSRSRTRSTSRSRMRNLEHGQRMLEKHRYSRSPSPTNRIKERKDEDNDKVNAYAERGRRIETIVQSVSGVTRVIADSTVLDPEIHIDGSIDISGANFQYSNENETGNDYYYTENNLTYPPCIDESTTSSPKRLSLDDRLELELGIKKQHGNESMGASVDYSNNFNSNIIAYPSPPAMQQQQMLYREQPTVLQVGNVLQVVPAEYNPVSMHREMPNNATPPVVRGSSQVVRVGNVLQVVPTSLDWSSAAAQSSTDHSGGVLYSATVPSPSPVSVPVSLPLPVPVPMPVPAVPSVVTTPAPVSTLPPAVPLSLSIPVPVPVPVPIPITPSTFPRTEMAPLKIHAQPVYNYEAILETRRKEKEERKRLRELRRKEKERRKIERINRRALRLLEKNNLGTRQVENVTTQDCREVSAVIDRSVIKALCDSEEQADLEDHPTSIDKDEEAVPPAAPVPVEEEEDTAVDEDEEEEEEEEAEVEEEDEDDEEVEEDEEEEVEDEDRSSSRVTNTRQSEVEEGVSASDYARKSQTETEDKDWPSLPPPPLKGILISPGFRRDLISNGDLDETCNAEDENEDDIAKEACEAEKLNTLSREDNFNENKLSKSKSQVRIKMKTAKVARRKKRGKKSVQFADGVKPGEGTSPSGGEGDMPSPPPPSSTISRDGLRELKKQSSRKNRKEKRMKPPKAKKKVKVKIIKLKKPRITPLTAMMMDDSDELDDRSPPPPPPGSPPPPHLWPSYLSAYNTTVRGVESQSTAATSPAVSSSVQAPPPPTPLPLLVPPPPLNYTIQPCSKA